MQDTEESNDLSESKIVASFLTTCTIRLDRLFYFHLVHVSTSMSKMYFDKISQASCCNRCMAAHSIKIDVRIQMKRGRNNLQWHIKNMMIRHCHPHRLYSTTRQTCQGENKADRGIATYRSSWGRQKIVPRI